MIKCRGHFGDVHGGAAVVADMAVTKGEREAPGAAAASKMMLSLDTSVTETSVVWLAQRRAGARSGTRIEWFNDNEPRISGATTKPVGGVYALVGDKPPVNDPSQCWGVRCVS